MTSTLFSLGKYHLLYVKLVHLSVGRLHINRPRLTDVRVRFAPSPTGNIHLGGLRTALYNFAFAKSHPGGKFILRIEDTDKNRTIPGAVAHVQDILNWAKIPPDESPSVGGPVGPYTQSERIGLYQDYVKELIDNGTAYKCFCSVTRLQLLRKEQQKNHESIKYDRNCMNLSKEKIVQLEDSGTAYTVRLKLDESLAFDDIVFGTYENTGLTVAEGDPIILKTDGFPTYHYANVVDDHLMGITHVLRGSEWLPSTPKHLLLYKAFGWNPPKFAHLPLLAGNDGKKISKRHGDSSVEVFQDQGYPPESVLNLLSSCGGAFGRNGPFFDSFTLDELVEKFDISKLNAKQHEVLEPAHLPKFSRSFLIKQLACVSKRTELLVECRDALATKYPLSIVDKISDEYLINVLEWDELLITHAQDLLSHQHSYLWEQKSFVISNSTNLPKNSNIIISELAAAIAALPANSFHGEILKNCLENIRQSHKLKSSAFYSFLRQILINDKNGPPIIAVCELIGKDKIITQLKSVIS